jgi:hypothetical protein
MATAKQEVLRILETLLEEASLEDVRYRRSVLRRVECRTLKPTA